MPTVCPSCGHPMRSAASVCSQCGALLAAQSLERYESPVGLLRDVTAKLQRNEIPMSAERVQGVYAYVSSTVQQVLDRARADLQKNLEGLASLRERGAAPGALRDESEFLDVFQEVQQQVDESLAQFRLLLQESQNPQDLANKQHVVQFVTASLQSAIDRLEVLTAETSDPTLAAAPAAPLPDALGLGLGAMEKALGAMAGYMRNPDRSALEACLRHLDDARGRVREVLEPSREGGWSGAEGIPQPKGGESSREAPW